MTRYLLAAYCMISFVLLVGSLVNLARYVNDPFNETVVWIFTGNAAIVMLIVFRVLGLFRPAERRRPEAYKRPARASRRRRPSAE